MNEQYFEIMVKKQPSQAMKTAQMAVSVLAGLGIVIWIMGFFPGLIIGAALVVASFTLNLFNNVEYEYLYVDKELQIDRIMAKSKRKRMETLDLQELELLAPVRSHQLDGYRNNNWEQKDYSSGRTEQGNNPYMLVFNGRKIIFEPTEELVKTIQMFAPRKVFTY